ncbi:DUF4376 domain-containing protein [Citrobacter portucalensis]|uniref:DUF4376 domain-containing protein n=1 Tax=Citrobacter portucalensis TaxID=1639133 RepID=UPI001580D0E3|nr:DUF4376 domain-containing protein [Citrobacter portucalensis]NUH52724.1 DUF4376 domain-containing protein [Citrobacter portucalensis]
MSEKTVSAIQVRNAVYDEAGNINCEVLFDELSGEWLPYTASSSDISESGRELFTALLAGQYGVIAPFTVTPEMLEAARAAKRQEIEAWRTEQEVQPFTFEWNGHIWNAGPDSLARLSPVTVAAKSEKSRDTFFWNDAGNQPVPMTMAQAEELAAAMAQAQLDRNNEIYMRQREMKEVLAELGGLSDIRKFVINGI